MTPEITEPNDQVYEPVPPVAEYVPVDALLPYVNVKVESPVTITAVGVSVTAVEESELPPFVTALIRMVYPVPLVRPVMISGEAVVPEALVVKVPPLFVEY